MDKAAVIKKIELLEAMADNIKDQCSQLKKELGLLPGTSKQKEIAAAVAKVIENSNRNLNKKRLAK